MVISYPGGSAEFQCIHVGRATIVDIQWTINGLPYETLDLRNITVTFLRADGDNSIQGGIFRFKDLPVEYNLSSISCTAVFSMAASQSSLASMLILQGKMLTLLNLHYNLYKMS